MSVSPGRYRLRLDIHIDVTDFDELDLVVREAALTIEKMLRHRKAVAGRFDILHHDALPKKEARR